VVVAVDVRDDAVELWSRTADGVEWKRDDDYAPTCYVDGPDDALAWLADRLAADPKVLATEYERAYTTLQDHRDGERSRVLAVTVERPSEVATFAREVRAIHEPAGDWPPGRFRLYDVDVSPKFRYCLAEGVEPLPEDVDRVRSLSISLPTHELAAENLAALTCEGERSEPSERASGSDRRERHASPAHCRPRTDQGRLRADHRAGGHRSGVRGGLRLDRLRPARRRRQRGAEPLLRAESRWGVQVPGHRVSPAIDASLRGGSARSARRDTRRTA